MADDVLVLCGITKQMKVDLLTYMFKNLSKSLTVCLTIAEVHKKTLELLFRK